MFLRPLGLYCSACFGILFVSVLCTCCNHIFWYCFIVFTMFCDPVFSPNTLILFFVQFCYSKCLKNFICAASAVILPFEDFTSVLMSSGWVTDPSQGESSGGAATCCHSVPPNEYLSFNIRILLRCSNYYPETVFLYFCRLLHTNPTIIT